jgi:hypothetical protein
VPALGRAREAERDLDRKVVRLRDYAALRDRLRDDLVARRCTLAEAVERLAASDQVRDPRWREATLCCRPGWALRECLADRLVRHALLSGGAGAPGAEQVARELNAQLQSCVGRATPARADERRDVSARSSECPLSPARRFRGARNDNRHRRRVSPRLLLPLHA